MLNNDYPDYVDSKSLKLKLGDAGTAMMEKKYLPKKDGKFQDPAERIYDVAFLVANVEGKYGASPNQVAEYTKKFYKMISNFDFLPGGRILSNTGTDIKSLANCYVLPVEDDLESIYQVVKNAAIIHKNGGGTGYNFSQLRPRGWSVKNGIASGPVSFAGQYDKETEIINSGNRRGANMGILNIDHPDILEFIRAKDLTGILTNFNISVGITDKFMHSYRSGKEYILRFNGNPFKRSDLENIVDNCERMKAGSDVGKKPVPPSLQIRVDKIWNVYPDVDIIRPDIRVLKYDKNGNVLTKEELVGTIDEDDNIMLRAEVPFKLIARYAHSRGDPGLIFLDIIEKDNLLPIEGRLDTTNPCGEQPLPPYGACDLGSVNLKNFITEDTQVDYKKLEVVVRYAIRFLDNINDLSEGPIPKIKQKMIDHRRTGLGIMGWADMLMKMRMSYDSEESYNLAEKVMGHINQIAKDESFNLAKEKGPFPFFEKSLYDQDRPIRNLARTTIAPTGSISMVAEVNSGIEPWYGLIYNKNMRGGDVIEVINAEFIDALKNEGIKKENIEKIINKVKMNNGSCSGIKEVPIEIQEAFKVSRDIDYQAHIEMQSRFQKHVDNAISKTINVPNEASVEDILKAYDLAHAKGCKGITVYRDGSLNTQVLETFNNKFTNHDRDLRLQLVNKELSKKRPERVRGHTVAQQTPYDHKAFVTLNLAYEDGDPEGYYFETFFQVGRSGGDLPALSEGIGRIASLAIKAGVHPRYIAEQLIGIGGETQAGIGPSKVKSLPDAFGKALENILSIEDKENNIIGVSKNNKILKKNQSGNLCPKCTGPLILQEGCQKCACGYSRC